MGEIIPLYLYHALKEVEEMESKFQQLFPHSPIFLLRRHFFSLNFCSRHIRLKEISYYSSSLKRYYFLFKSYFFIQFFLIHWFISCSRQVNFLLNFSNSTIFNRKRLFKTISEIYFGSHVNVGFSWQVFMQTGYLLGMKQLLQFLLIKSENTSYMVSI